MIPSDPVFHKPKDIIAAKNIIYATMFLGVIGWVIVKMSGVPADRMSGIPSGQANPEIRMIAGAIGVVIALVILFILARQIGLGRKWARTVYLAVIILRIVLACWMIQLLKANILFAVVFLLQMILALWSLKFLFSEKSTHWFNSVQSFVPGHPANR
jgi:hypothetical protein